MIYSNNPLTNVFEYDTNKQISLKTHFKKNLVKSMRSDSNTEANLAVFGEQTNAVPSLQAAY